MERVWADTLRRLGLTDIKGCVGQYETRKAEGVDPKFCLYRLLCTGLGIVYMQWRRRKGGVRRSAR